MKRPTVNWTTHEVPPVEGWAGALSSERLVLRWGQDDVAFCLDDRVLARWLPAERTATAWLPPARRGWLAFLRWMVDRGQLEFEGGATLHASAVAVGGRALVACGASGIGKSTLRSLAPREARLCDEFADMLLHDGEVWLCHGDRVWPVTAVLTLAWGEPRLEALTPSAAAMLLFKHRYTGPWHERHPGDALAWAAAAARQLSVHRYWFTPRRSSIDWLAGHAWPQGHVDAA